MSSFKIVVQKARFQTVAGGNRFLNYLTNVYRGINSTVDDFHQVGYIVLDTGFKALVYGTLAVILHKLGAF